MRLFFLLADVYPLADLHTWARGAQLSGLHLDPAVLQPGQPIYTSRPLFRGSLTDPVPVALRALVLPGQPDRVRLDIHRYVKRATDIESRVERVSSLCGGDWRRLLEGMLGGPAGFYLPLTKALGWRRARPTTRARSSRLQARCWLSGLIQPVSGNIGRSGRRQRCGGSGAPITRCGTTSTDCVGNSFPTSQPMADKWDHAAEEARREARERGNGAAPDSNRKYGPQGSSRRRRDFKCLLNSAAFMAQMKPPDYLVDGLLLRGATYTLTGNAGHGKTLVALLLTIKVARGDWFCGKKCRQGTVAFFAGENPENVRVQFYSMCRELGIDPATLSIVWYDGVFNLNQAREKARAALAGYPDLALCIFDSFQAYFTGDDDSQNMPMLEAAINFRELSEGHPNGPASLILAHPTKNATRDNLLLRGGSALTNELDGNLTCWLETDKNVVTLHWHGKYRGVPFDPIKLETVVIKPEGLVNADGYQMQCTIVRALGEMREAELAEQSENRQMKALAAIATNPKIKLHEIATLIGQAKTTAKRTVDGLIGAKWVRRSGSRLRLTKDGQAALDERQN